MRRRQLRSTRFPLTPFALGVLGWLLMLAVTLALGFALQPR